MRRDSWGLRDIPHEHRLLGHVPEKTMTEEQPENSDAALHRASRRACQGDLEAMGEVVKLTHHRVRGFLRTVCADLTEVDDLAQETYLVTFAKLQKLEDPSQLLNYLLGVAKKLALNHNRKMGRQGSIREDHMAEIAERLSLLPPESPGWYSDGDLQAALRFCLQKLSEENRTLLRKRYRDGVDSAQLAEQTSLGRSAVRMRLMRLRTSLRQCIQQQAGIGGGQLDR